MGNLGHASLDRGDDEDRAGTHGRCLAVDEGVVHGYDEGGSQDRQRVERDDTKVDFPGGHLHAFDIGKCAALGCGSGDDVHSDVGEKDASERCPVDRPRRSGQWFHVTLVGGGGIGVPDTEKSSERARKNMTDFKILIRGGVCGIEE